MAWLLLALCLTGIVCVGWTLIADFRGFNPHVPILVRLGDVLAVIWFLFCIVRYAWREVLR